MQELPPPARRSGSLPWNPAWVGAALSGDDHLEVVAQFDLTDPAAWSATFAGAERMFLLRPPQLFRVRRDLLPALEAAAAGVGHVVFRSIQGRPQPAGAHRAVEDHRRASPMAWTILRASYFLQNRSTTHAPEVRERALVARRQGPHRLRGRPRRRRVAARAHTVRSHQGTACILTGPAALTDDVRRLTGRPPRDFGSFTRDHASPGRQPPWPLPERLA